MYLEWRRQTRAGMKHLMQAAVPLYERTKLFRIYEHYVIPGLFQTAEYSAAILAYFVKFLEIPDDIDAAVEARMERQRVIYSGDRRFVVVLAEEAVRARVGSIDTMAGQLDRVLAVMSLPRVSLGNYSDVSATHDLRGRRLLDIRQRDGRCRDTERQAGNYSTPRDTPLRQDV
jgi:hypothetical protein